MKSLLIAALCGIAVLLGMEYILGHVFSFAVSLGTSTPVLVLLRVGEWEDADAAAFMTSWLFGFAVFVLLAARFERREGKIIVGSKGPLTDGRLVALTGTMEALGEPLVAPFSGQTCLAYDYEVQHQNSLDEHPRGEVTDRVGFALAPCAIRTGGRLITLLAFPELDAFPKSATDGARAKNFVVSTKFEKTDFLDSLLRYGEVAKIINLHGGAVRQDFQLSSYDVADPCAYFTERILHPGEKVTVVGRYSASKKALLAEPYRSTISMFRGTKGQALAAARDLRKTYLIMSGCCFVMSVLVAAGFILYWPR